MNRASAHSFTWQAEPAYGNINSQRFHFSTGHGNQHQMSEKFTSNDITSVDLILTSRNIHLTMFFLSSDFYPMPTECVWGKQWRVYQKSLQVKHEDCEQVRAVRSWHSPTHPTPRLIISFCLAKGWQRKCETPGQMFSLTIDSVWFFMCVLCACSLCICLACARCCGMGSLKPDYYYITLSHWTKSHLLCSLKKE